MTGRILVVILFFWAVLTIVTPTLVLWSASAKPQIDVKVNGEEMEEMYTRRVLGILSRRALVPTSSLPKAPPAPAPAPGPAPATDSLLGSENLQVL